MSQQYDNRNPVGNPRILDGGAEGEEFREFASLLTRLVVVPKSEIDEQRAANA